MIESMKKVEILLYHLEREAFLASLAEAGVLHIEEKNEAMSEVSEGYRAQLVTADKAITQLKREVPEGSCSLTAEEAIERTLQIVSRNEAIANEKTHLEKEENQLLPWGDFSPALLQKLAAKGVYFHFYEVATKEKQLLENSTWELISQNGSKMSVVVFAEDDSLIPGLDPIHLPEMSLSEIRAEIVGLEKETAELHNEIKAIATALETINKYRTGIEESLLVEMARLSMAKVTADKILHLTGWVPTAKESAVTEVLEGYSCWFEISEPEDEDTIPVKLKNKGGFKLFEPLTKMFSLPDYYEIDPTPFIAPFFALFFGLCLGDLGYGLIVFIGALVALNKVAPKMKPAVQLVMILGGMTAISGFVLNTFFGNPIFAGNESGLLAQMAFLKTSEGSNIFPAMAFAVYLGFTQIILGNILRTINTFKSSGFKFMLPNIATLTLIIAAFLKLVSSNFLDMRTFALGSFELGEVIGSMPGQLSNVLGIIGLVLMLLFNSPKKGVGYNLGMFIIAMYNFATSLLGDSLSYIRLFALGLAGGLLGLAFNQLALSFITIDGVVNWLNPMAILTIVVMVLGHSLNFFLALIGSFVHPLRLTFVEFYGNLDFKGGSVPYKPFTNNLEN